MGAQDAEGPELADRSGGVAGKRGVDHGEAGSDGALADWGEYVEGGRVGDVGVEPGDALGLVGEGADGGVCVAGGDGVGEPLDAASEAVDGAEDDDAVADGGR